MPAPFASALSANVIPAVPITQINQLIRNTYRNSFDFMEMESQSLWEMTGDSYKKFVNQSLFAPTSTFYSAQPTA